MVVMTAHFPLLDGVAIRGVVAARVTSLHDFGEDIDKLCEALRARARVQYPVKEGRALLLCNLRYVRREFSSDGDECLEGTADAIEMVGTS